MQKTEMKALYYPASSNPLTFNDNLCIGCNRCMNVCQVDIMIPAEEKGKHPIVLYPGECYYCGSCVMVCPKEGAIHLTHPLMNRTKFTKVVIPENI